MRYANIKKYSQEKQQNETTTKIYLFKNFVRFKNKFSDKIYIASDKTETQ